jgi:hypothetical protein
MLKSKEFLSRDPTHNQALRSVIFSMLPGILLARLTLAYKSCQNALGNIVRLQKDVLELSSLLGNVIHLDRLHRQEFILSLNNEQHNASNLQSATRQSRHS